MNTHELITGLRSLSQQGSQYRRTVCRLAADALEGAGRPIEVEGYKAFRGTMRMTYANPTLAHANGLEDDITGDWLYNPNTDCWYHGGRSFPAKACHILEVTP